ncbi:MAG: hypothetical protein HQ492_09890, partial [Woeseiaceae bacterium]|nr:hypothetical protein [Woeseiaceae bacterium]
MNAVAAEPLSCQTSLDQRLSTDPFLPLTPLANPETILLEAGNVEAQLGEMPTALMSGGVLLRR